MAVEVTVAQPSGITFPRIRKGQASGNLYYVLQHSSGRISAVDLKTGIYVEHFAYDRSDDYASPVTLSNKD